MAKIENSFDKSLRDNNFLRLLGELNFKQLILNKEVGELRRKYSVRRVQSGITVVYSEIFIFNLGHEPGDGGIAMLGLFELSGL